MNREAFPLDPEEIKEESELNSALDAFFNTNDPEELEIIKITTDTRDPNIVKQYLEENEKELSPEAKHLLAISIRIKRRGRRFDQEREQK